LWKLPTAHLFGAGGFPFSIHPLPEICKVASEAGSEHHVTKSGPGRRSRTICRIPARFWFI